MSVLVDTSTLAKESGGNLSAIAGAEATAAKQDAQTAQLTTIATNTGAAAKESGGNLDAVVARLTTAVAALATLVANSPTLQSGSVPVVGTITSSGSVSVSNFPATQPVSAASLPLPSGAAISAKQPALGTAGVASTDVITVQGIASGTAQPVSGTVTATQATGSNLHVVIDAASAKIGIVTTDQTTHGTTDLVAADLTKIAGTAPTTAGKLDVKGADGDVFVRQSTATNLKAQVTGAGTAGTPDTGIVSVQGVSGGTTVQVGGISAVASASFTRSANTTAYSASQVVTASGGGAVAISGCVQAAGRSGLLLSVTLFDAVNAATPLQPTIYLFNAAPTSIADNATLALVSGDISKHVHTITLFESYLTNSSGQRVWVARGLSIPYSIASGTSLYAYVVAGAAYTPVSGEVFNIILGTEQN